MNRKSSIIAGVILIVVGAFFLLLSLIPGLESAVAIETQWPLIIVGVGVLFLIGAVAGSPALAVPGTILTGLGAMMYYQSVFDAWETWAYSWALIPGFVGLGIIIMALLQGKGRGAIKEGGPLIVISAILFVVFGVLIGGILNFQWMLALLLIVVGLWQLVKALR